MFLRSAHVQETICAWYHLLWDVLYATSCSYHAPTPLSTTGFDPRLHRLPRGDASGPRTCIGWGGLGRFELAPPCFPQHSTVGTPRGNSLGRSPHSNAQADGDTCRSFARPAWLHRTMPEASITREGERGEDLHSTWGQKRAAYHPSPPRQRVRTRCENQAYIARTPWEKTQPSQQ